MHKRVFLRGIWIGAAIWLFGCIPAFCQFIKVVDISNQNPVEHVTIYSENGTSALTNQRGIADVSIFKHNTIIYFQHPAYENKSIPASQVDPNDTTVVFMTESIISMNEIVISANRWAQSKTEIPQKISTINKQNITFNNPQTSADLLGYSGEVFVQKSQLGGGSPMIRGFSANSVLIVVDGIRMNNAIFRSGNLQNVISIDPATVNQAEVIFGPGSVMYGSDALGGVMSFQTIPVNFSTNQSLLVTGNGFVRTSSTNNEKTIHGHVNISGQRLGSFTSISFSDFKDLKSGKNHPEKFPEFGKKPFIVKYQDGVDIIQPNENPEIQSPSAYDQINFNQKLSYKINNKYTLNYSLNLSTTSDIPRYDRLIEIEDNEPTSAEWYYGPQEWMMNSLQLHMVHGNRFFDRGKITFSHQAIKESRHNRNFNDPRLGHRTEKVNVYACNLDFDKYIQNSGHLFFGIESIYNDINSSAYRENIVTGETSYLSTRYPSGGSNYGSLALYSSFLWHVSEKTTLNAGVRFNRVELNASVSEEDDPGFGIRDFSNSNTSVNGSLGVVYKPTETWQLNLVASNGFRAPNVDDIGKLFEGSNGILTVPNPDLKPEYAYNMEASATKIVGKGFKIEGVAYYTHLKNAMVRSDFLFNGQESILFEGRLNRVVSLVNSGKAHLYGGSLKMKLIAGKGFSFSSSLNLTEGKDLTNQEPLRHASPFFTRSRIKYDNQKFTGEIVFSTQAGKSLNQLAPEERDKTHLYTSDGSLPWQTFDLKLAYRINDTWSTFGGIENIFDLHYRPYSWGLSAPGRNFYLSLHVNF